MVVLPASGCEMMAKVRRLETSLLRGLIIAATCDPSIRTVRRVSAVVWTAMGRSDSAAHRCSACRMHRTLCICALIQPIATRTRLLLILHQLEQDKPTNTGRLAARCLTSSLVIERGVDTVADASASWSVPGTQAF